MNTCAVPVHPRTGESALGFRRDGRPIWPIKGGSGEGGDPSAPPAPAGEQGSNPPNTDPGTPPAPPAADPATEQQLVAAQQQATEAAEQRDQLQAALEPVNKALNPAGAAAEQDPAKLAAYWAAGEQGARADRLLNSRSFVSTCDIPDRVPKSRPSLHTAGTTNQGQCRQARWQANRILWHGGWRQTGVERVQELQGRGGCRRLRPLLHAL
ncbi:hypothetical protein [Streptomyces gardneri]|uniref:hypothetical protein n=1 Tax=Streptomyces gardneri TaxID=66892 RepID=UPI0037D989B2